MTATYDCIATTTLGSDTANITFTSIPGTYTDLVLVGNLASATADRIVYIQYNSDTATNYSFTDLYGTGSGSGGSLRVSNGAQIYAMSAFYLPTAANTFSPILMNVMNYSNTTTFKTCLIRMNNANSGVEATVGLWRSTSAITSIKIFLSSASNIKSGSMLTLYGIKSE